MNEEDHYVLHALIRDKVAHVLDELKEGSIEAAQGSTKKLEATSGFIHGMINTFCLQYPEYHVLLVYRLFAEEATRQCGQALAALTEQVELEFMFNRSSQKEG